MEELETKDEDVDRQIALDDLIHEIFARKASEINNEGEEGQIAFLKSEGWTEEEIEEQIKETLEGDAQMEKEIKETIERGK